MATTTFGKNFQVSKRDSDVFVKFMNEDAKPLIDNNFKSNIAHVDEYKESFEKAFSNI